MWAGWAPGKRRGQRRTGNCIRHPVRRPACRRRADLPPYTQGMPRAVNIQGAGPKGWPLSWASRAGVPTSTQRPR